MLADAARRGELEVLRDDVDGDDDAAGRTPASDARPALDGRHPHPHVPRAAVPEALVDAFEGPRVRNAKSKRTVTCGALALVSWLRFKRLVHCAQLHRTFADGRLQETQTG